MRTPIERVFSYGQLSCVLQTADVGGLASNAVRLKIDDTLLLAMVTRREPDWLAPGGVTLTVEYYECVDAVHRIPGADMRREGGMTPRESDIARTVHRAIQACIAPQCQDEIQVVIHVPSAEPGCDVELGALLASSAALRLSSVPIIATPSAARVALSKGRFSLNPSADIRLQADLTVLAAGTAPALSMVNAQAAEMPEDVVIDAIAFAHLQLQVCIREIDALAEQVGLHNTAKQPLAPHRYPLFRALEALRTAVRIEDVAYARMVAVKAFDAQLVRSRLLGGGLRTEGRRALHLRKLSSRCGVLPEAHGSALVSQMHNQTLCSVTLGNGRGLRWPSIPLNRSRERLLVHVERSAFAPGKLERVRLIGHFDSQLAAFIRSALAPVMPTKADYPKACRLTLVVRESTDLIPMHSVCAASLALQDAGVPLRRPVVGVSVGALHNHLRNYVMLDAIGPEQVALNVQARMAGTSIGVTALQLDFRSATPLAVLHELLARARDAREDLTKQLPTSSRSPSSVLGAEMDAFTRMNRVPVDTRGDTNAH
ncbi:hypothetical protein ACOTHT_18055 [Achromobacter xylosoxidans]